MCRNIKPLFNFDPPATDHEIYDASLQFVRKVSGYTKPSEINEKAFNEAVEKITRETKSLISSLKTTAPRKNRAEEEAKAHTRAIERFGPAGHHHH